MLLDGGHLSPGRCAQIQDDFRTFCHCSSGIGHNAITLDDLAHCCIFPFYSVELRRKVDEYRGLYHSLYAIAAEYRMQVFITTDLLFFFNDEIIGRLKRMTADYEARYDEPR